MSVQHHEHFLREILDFAGIDTQSLQSRKDVVELAIECSKACMLWRGHGRSGVNET
jgi:hypothetical protein